MTWYAQEPFLGELPDVEMGTGVECRDAAGQWVPRVAMSKPRYDHDHATGRTVWMSVAVASPEDWAREGVTAPWVNWPAEHVRRIAP